MPTRATHDREGVLEIRVLLHRHHVVDALGRNRLDHLGLGVGAFGRAEDVFQVHIADRYGCIVDDHVAREPVSCDRLLDVVGRRRLGQRDQIAQWHRDVPRLLVGELDRCGDCSRRVHEHAFTTRLADDGRDLIERERRCGLVLGLDPEQAQDAVGCRVEHPDHGHEHLRHPHQRWGEDQHGTVRHRERQVLRHHLAEHHVQEGHDHQCDRERHGVDRTVRPPERVQRHGEQMVDRRLGHIEDEKRADRDAQLRRREHQRRVFHRVQRGLRGARALVGSRLDLRSSGRDHRELGTDEERIRDQEHDEPGESCPIAHRVTSSSPSRGFGT